MRLAQLTPFDHRRRHHASRGRQHSRSRSLAAVQFPGPVPPFWDRDLDREAAEFIEEEISRKLAAQVWNFHVHAHGGGTSPTGLQTALGNYYGRTASSARRAVREQPAAPEESFEPARDQRPDSH